MPRRMYAFIHAVRGRLVATSILMKRLRKTDEGRFFSLASIIMVLNELMDAIRALIKVSCKKEKTSEYFV